MLDPFRLLEMEETADDRRDVEFLIGRLSLTTDEQILGIVEQFYPADRIPIRTRYFITEIVAGLAERKRS